MASISLPNSITTIGIWAFNGCRALTSVTLPSGMNRISDSLFHDCRGLTSITIPSTITILGQAAFHSCTGLTSVSIPSSLTYISDSAFYNCTSLTSVTLPSSVTTLQAYAFGACTGLTRVFFMGNAPSVAANSFTGVTALGFYQSGTTGWTNPFFGLTMAMAGAPTVTSPTSASIASTTATLGGNVTSDGGATVTARGVVIALTSANTNPRLAGTGVTAVAGTGTTGVFTVSATGLNPGSAYSYAAYATNSAGTSYTTVGTFTTLGEAPTITTQPSATSATAGTAASFTVVASGTAPLTYVWRKDGTAITGATSATYTISAVAAGDAGSYTVVVTNSAGSATSNAATLTVTAAVIAPTITTQPSATSATAGIAASFSVVASGTAPLTYVWRKDGTAIAGATSATYTIASVATGDDGSYTVVVTNSAGSATSNAAALTVTAAVTAPTITTQPSATRVAAGTAASFTVAASGTAPLTYVWRKDGTAIAGATSATYTIASVATGDDGSYTVVVTNSAGSATSNAAALTVTAAVTAPTITTQPSATSVTAGTAASFTVAASGTAPLTYVWRKDGTAIAGATSATYTIASVATGDAGSYTVVVTNSAGSATSNAAALTVTAALTAPTVTTPTATNITATTATLGGDVTSDGGAKIDARGVVYALTSDNSAPRLGGKGVTNVSGTGTTGVFAVNVTGLTPNVSYSYMAYATNNRGTTYSTVGTFKTLDSAGSDFTYQDTGGGLVITGYRGASRAVVIPSSIGGVAVTGIGSYAFSGRERIVSITIPDSVTSIASYAFFDCYLLESVTLPKQLTSIEEAVFFLCVNLRSITIPDSVTSIGDNSFRTCISLQSVTLSNRLIGIGVAAFFNCAKLTNVTIPASVTEIKREAFKQCRGIERVIFLGDAPKGGEESFKDVTAKGFYQSGTKGWTPTYYGLNMVMVSGDFTLTDNGTAATITGYLGAGGAVTIPSTIGGKPVTTIDNGAFSGLAALTSVTIPTSVTRIADAAFQGCTGLTSVTLPSKLTELGTGVFAGCEKLSAITIPSGLTALRTSVFLGCTALTTVTIPSTITTIEDGAFFGCTGLKSIYFLGNAPTATALSFKFVTALGIRQSEATGWTNTFYGLNIYIGLNGLTIKSGPVGATINQGQNATFSVVAEGTGPFIYQWRKDGAVLTGATAATLRLVNVTVAQAGNYSVTVSNTQGTTTSNAAALTVNSPLTLTSNPVSRTAAIGDTLAPAFSVTATAASGVTLSYQWRKDGLNIPGATSAILVLTAIKATDFGTYSVTITSPTGTLTSTGAVLSRAADPVEAPVITRDPANVTINLGSSLILSVAATGSPAPTYQWQFNGASIPGANAATLVLTDVIAAQAGTYNVVATNSGGSATSKSATVATSSGFGRQRSISTRGYVGTGGDILIPGFFIAGNGTKRLLIRAAGPALDAFGVPGVLADPQLAVFKERTLLLDNDDWSADPSKAAVVTFFCNSVGAFPFAGGSKDAALVISLEPGAYTIQVSGVGNTTGTAIVEVYDLDEADANKSRLANLATRALVQAGAGPLISGFVVQGAVAKAVLIRATGPALAGFGVTGTLAQPKLTLFDDQRRPILENTGWESSGVSDQIIAASQSVGAFGLTRGTADSVILAVLPPGGYTAQVIGADGGSGVTLVEVYELP